MSGQRFTTKSFTIQGSTKKSATIIGGSIAGLTAGLALLQRGWQVNIFEATDGELQKRGAGIITHQSLFDALDNLKIKGRENVGVHIQSRKIFAKSGNVSSTLELPQIATSWGQMYQLLKEAFPVEHYHQIKELVHFEQTDNRVKTWFEDGSEQQCDLLIAADGIRSTIRQKLEPDAVPEYAGYVAWRGLIEECDLTTLEKETIFPYFTFCLPEGEQVLTYPIAGPIAKNNQPTDNGKRRCNVVWYRPAASETTLVELLTDTDGNNNGESIAPNKVRSSVINKMQQDAEDLLSPQHTALIKRLVNPFIQPIYDLTTKTMAHGRIAIVGDAAFTARPHLGVGITKAVEDALALAKALEGHSRISDAILHFNDQRYKANRRSVDRSRELGAYLQAHLISDDQRRFAQQHRASEAVMLETANPLAMH